MLQASEILSTVTDYFLFLQKQICSEAEKAEENHRFIEDFWRHQQGEGGGRTRVLADGKVFEKAGVNFSHVQGLELPPTATLKRPELKGHSFQAAGVSVVIHPQNPYVPTSHANFRLLLVEKKNQALL